MITNLTATLKILDIDDCANPDLNAFDVNAECNNIIGSYRCSCHSDYFNIIMVTELNV